MWSTPLGDNFRQLLEMWSEKCLLEDKKNQIRMMIDGQNFVLFFHYSDEVYGTHEPHRVTFAKLRNPDNVDDPEGWEDDANFMAVNLTQAISGRPTQHMFKKDDMPRIEVISKDDAEKELYSLANNPKDVETGAKMLAKTSPPKDQDHQGISLNQDD